MDRIAMDASLQPQTQPIVARRPFQMSSTILLALCFFGIFLAGLAVRYHGISTKPFWMDEVTTIHRAKLPLDKMVPDALFFHQLPSFFVITSWALPFGHDEFFVRLPAMLFGAASCALGFGVARALGGTPAGLATGLLMAFSPAQVQYGQEARSYTMLICAILLALWGLVLLAQNLPAAARSWRNANAARGAWAAYTIGTIAALNILSVALFWFVAANLAAVFLVRRPGAAGFWRNWLLAQCVVILFCLPWFVAIKLLGQRGVMGGLDWVPPLNLAHIWWAFASTYFMYITSLITVREFTPGVPGLGFLVVILAACGFMTLRRRMALFTVLAAAVLVLPLSLLAISTVSPVLMPRYLLWSAAPFFVCAGLGVTLLPPRLQLPAVAALGLLLVLNLRPYYHDETKPRWDLAATELHAGLHTGDLILVDDPQAIRMMNIYLRRQGVPLATGSWTQNIAQAQAWRTTGGRVWAVQGLVGQVDHESQAQFLSRIASLGAPKQTEHAGLDILLMRFDAAPAPQASN